MNLVTIYQPFNTQDKGFLQLKTLTDNQTNKKDSLIADIVKFYSAFKPVLTKSNDRMEDLVMSNFKDFEKFPWFMDMAQANFTEDLISYFTESEDYRKRVASHTMLAATNHLRSVMQYKSQANLLLVRIKERIQNTD